ncbi:hypothetical protein [Yersinia intermedia]|uniref:hypothetical protein n=1 Tax=Yersinia intermedia TaxID=631 RepID=UPI0005E211E7|nr:hypothetical protein [Yersinia intermedia]CNI98071.1 Predicted hydrolase (HAD superfamily) [Yersinia intermedia]
MKNILYYLEPRTELNDPLFRYATLRSHILPEIKGLKEFKPELEIKIVVSEALFTEAKKNNLDLDNADFIVISNSELDKIETNNNELSIQFYNSEGNEKDSIYIIQLLKEKLDNFLAEVIISYESPTPFLKDIYPTALHLNSMFGLFSRAPFPAFGLLDPFGLYEHSYQSIYAEKIKEHVITIEQKELMTLLRKNSIKALAKYQPLKNYISILYERFERLVVLACQVDDYFSYNGCTKYMNQFEMVKDVLENTPHNIGVIVTEHGYKKQLSEDQVLEFKEKFSNFIYFDNENKIPTITQFILPYVDGALSVSSSIGYQAALWKIPYYSLGKSQLSIFSKHIDFNSFYNGISEAAKDDSDNVLYFLLSRVHFSHKFDIFNGENYYNKITSIYSKFINDGLNFNIFSDEKTNQEVYDIINQGNREWLLSNTFKELKITPEVDHLRVAMADSEAISFDLFDTLAERDFVEPHELFLFIEPLVRKLLNNKNFQFHTIRRQAEIELRRDSRGDFEITLDQIYERFEKFYPIDSETLEKIKLIEIDAEITLVHPKSEMIREYYFSKLICKTTNVITDIYLDQCVIERILNKIGVRDYDKLLVSSEQKTRKHNGTIYPEYLSFLNKNYNIPTNKALHIGDNSHADGSMAKKHGMKSYVFQKSMDNYKQSKISQVMAASIKSSGISSSVLNGMFANKYNAGHWFKINKTSIFRGDEYNYGYMAIGPLVVGFVQWLYRRAKRLGIDKLYFLSRDGWVLKQVYDKLYKDTPSAPKSFYLYSSRRAAMVASIREIDDIIEIASQNFNARSISDFLESRFGINSDDIDKKTFQDFGFKKDSVVSPYFDQGKLFKFLKKISGMIISNAEKERNSYLDYLNELNFINNSKNKNIAVVDIGYSGSMQYYLKKILQADVLHGFYFLTHHHSRDFFQNDHFEGYLQNLDDHKIPYRHGLNDHVFIFEAALSAPEGSLIKFENQGKLRKIVFLDAEEEIIRKSSLIKIHNGVIDFASDLKNRFSSYISNIEFPAILSSRIILSFANNPNAIDAKMFSGYEVENIFGGGSVCLIAPPLKHHFQENNKLRPEFVEQLLSASKWKKGADSYYSSLSNTNTPINNNKKNIRIENPTRKVINSHPAFIEKSIKQRKLAKFRKDPYTFFADSKKENIKLFRIFFKQNTFFGRLSTKMVRIIIR